MFPCRVRLHVFWVFFLVLCAAPFARALDWPPLDAADLAMKSIPQQPGAPAVILLREENDDDHLHFHSTYERIKILTEDGRKYADIQLPYNRHGFRIDSVSGRTVHTDGTAVPFEGKPFDKTTVKGHGFSYKVKAFTLPDVQVGSVIEYRYSLRYDDNTELSPEWDIQRELFQKSVSFKFIPFDFSSSSTYLIVGHGQTATGLAWTSYVPSKDYTPKEAKGMRTYAVELAAQDIQPYVEEPYSPPARSSKWRVSFYYTAGSKEEDYWKTESKFWNKDVEAFLDHRNGAGETLAKITTGSDTPEQKVRKIYAFVGGLENRSYIPARATQEEHALEIRPNKNAGDVLEQRSGYHDELNRLFAALVREAGLPASMMQVPDRSETFFDAHFLNTNQFDAEVVIVELNGKEVFLDPGTKFCAYGLLNWRYGGNQGLRQGSGKSAEFGTVPLSTYNEAMTQRAARLKLSEDGKYEGTVTIGFAGLEALNRRNAAALTDAEGRKKALEDEVKQWLPGGSDISVSKIPKWDDVESMVVAEFKVSGPLATSAGKRWLLPAHFFQVNESAKFPAAKRTNPIYLYYPYREIDEVRITLPAAMEMESLPQNDEVKRDYALYKTTNKMESPSVIYSRRDLAMGGMAFPAAEYADVKAFYDKVKTGDDQPAMIKAAAHAPSN